MMLKRKYANLPNWERLREKRYVQEYVKVPEFEGVVGLVFLDSVEKPMWVRHTGKELCIADNGFQWLQYFPKCKNHTVTAIYDEQGEIVQWYIDICLLNGLEDGNAFMDDLFLDLILLPTGEVFEKDKDEIEAALKVGAISRSQYDMAYREFYRLLEEIQRGGFPYKKLANTHKMLLEQNLAMLE